jgi:hypothetical protein
MDKLRMIKESLSPSEQKSEEGGQIRWKVSPFTTV